MIKLLRGDCLDRLPEILDGSVDLVVTDPPYKMTPTGNSCRPNYMPGGYIIGNEIPKPEDWFAEVFRVLAPQSHFYTFVNNNDLREYLNAAQRVGFNLHNVLSMIKDTKMPNRWYLKYTERILFFRKGKAFAINDKTSRDYVLATMPTQRNGKVHPTQKPLAVVQKLVENSSQPGQVVLDLFMGSGETGIACLETRRDFIGIEKDRDIFVTALERIKAHRKSLA